MNDEQISALMDDELPVESSRQALAELLSEPPTRATWGRYHLIGDALRSADETRSAGSRTGNIISFPAPPPRSLLKVGLGLAAAAAIAALAFTVLQPGSRTGTPAPAVAINSAATVPAIPIASTENNAAPSTPVIDGVDPLDSQYEADGTTSQNVVVRADEAQQRMNTYLFNFNEQRARQRTPGVRPYVHIVGYETP